MTTVYDMRMNTSDHDINMESEPNTPQNGKWLHSNVTKDNQEEYNRLNRIIKNYELEIRIIDEEIARIDKMMNREPCMNLECQKNDLKRELEEVEESMDVYAEKRGEIYKKLLVTTHIDTQCHTAMDWVNFRPYNDVDKMSLQMIKSALKTFIVTLQDCACCERHQKKRPTLLDYEEGHTGNYAVKETTGYDKCEYYGCNCLCRQTSRFICRRLHEIEGSLLPNI